jgi:hypothetical protein
MTCKFLALSAFWETVERFQAFSNSSDFLPP